MGQSFYTPVDDLGPKKEAVFPTVITRLAASFRATDYDMKELFRTVMNTETYQRQIRPGDSTDEHLHFAAAYPKRLRADALDLHLNDFHHLVVVRVLVLLRIELVRHRVDQGVRQFHLLL